MLTYSVALQVYYMGSSVWGYSSAVIKVRFFWKELPPFWRKRTASNLFVILIWEVREISESMTVSYPNLQTQHKYFFDLTLFRKTNLHISYSFEHCFPSVLHDSGGVANCVNHQCSGHCCRSVWSLSAVHVLTCSCTSRLHEVISCLKPIFCTTIKPFFSRFSKRLLLDRKMVKTSLELTWTS